MSETRTGYNFDTSNVDWRPFLTEGCYYKLLSVDVPMRHADMLVKFDPHCVCMYHRHAAVVGTLVLEGELHVREQHPDGTETIKVKPAGSYSYGGVGEVHIEGAGDKEAIIFYTMQCEGDVIYELLNDDLTLRQAITVSDFAYDLKRRWGDQQAAA